jgi:ABC-type glutathione transport system ATPase component
MAEQGMTVILVEHKVEWIAQFADRVIALQDGHLLLDGSPSEVLTSPILEESGFGISRYTSVARNAQELGLWKRDRLPATLEEAVEGFSLIPSLRSPSQSVKGGEEQLS